MPLEVVEVDASGVQIRDGSGLSRHNYLSPSFIVSFLKAMMGSPAFGDYIQTIGVAGGAHYESRLASESADVIEAIAAMSPERVVYVSCDPSTLARDVSYLQKSYRVESVQPFDMFPQTSHVETVVSLSLKNVDKH